MSTTTERTTLDESTITAGADLFAPDAASVAARVLWVIDVTESTGSNATQVAADIDAYYQLKGTANPRGYGRASIVNSATTGKLWDRTTLGKGQGTYSTADGKSSKGTHIQLIDRLDSARNAHGAKTVGRLIDETLESLATNVAKGVKYGAVMDALQALIDSPVVKDQKSPKVPTIADVINLLTKAHDLAEQIDLSEAVCGAISDAIEITGRETE